MACCEHTCNNIALNQLAANILSVPTAFAAAIGFNAAGIVLAIAGLLSPWLAALFHHLSSMLAVLNSALLGRDKHQGEELPSGRIQQRFYI